MFRKNCIRVSGGQIFKPIFVMESAENAGASNGMSVRYPMPISAHRCGSTWCRRYARPQTHVRPRLVIVRDPGFQNQPEMTLIEGIRKSRHSRRIVPPNRSQKAFAVGALTGVRSARTPLAVTSLSNCSEKMLSRS